MTSALQNRLVGTIIVVALIVIFVPEFLDGEKRTNQRDFVNVPPVTSLVEVEKTEDFDQAKVELNVAQETEVSDEKAIDEENDVPLTQNNIENKALINTEERIDETTENQARLTKDDIETKQVVSQTQQEIDTLAKNKSDNEAVMPSPNDHVAQPHDDKQENDTLSQIEVKDSGWVVQLGSFRHEKNVKELLRTLNDAGYRTYTRPVITSAGELTKVFVGPELEKQKLEQALSHLQEITKLKGKITPFEVSAK